MARGERARRQHVAMLVGVAVVGSVLGAFALSVTGSAATATSTANLNPGQIGTIGTNVQHNCNQGTGWIFVLPAAGGDAFVSLSATFQTAGTVAGIVDAGNPKFARVDVPLTDKLLGATAQVTGGDEDSQFNLTHVCGGGCGCPTSTTTTTTTVAPTTTSTAAPTTTSTSTPTSTSTTTSTTIEPTTTTTTTAPTTTTSTSTTTSTTVEPTTTTSTTVEGVTSTTAAPTTTSTTVEGETSTTTTSIENLGSTTTSVPGDPTTTTSAVAPAGSTTPGSSASAGPAALPFTGSDVAGLATFGGALTIAGLVLARKGRRRTNN